MPRVEIYTIPYCFYCSRAKHLLDAKKIAYVEHDVSADAGALARMHAATSRRTFPQIFIDGASVGGSDDLHDLDRSGELDRMLAREPEDAP